MELNTGIKSFPVRRGHPAAKIEIPMRVQMVQISSGASGAILLAIATFHVGKFLAMEEPARTDGRSHTVLYGCSRQISDN